MFSVAVSGIFLRKFLYLCFNHRQQFQLFPPYVIFLAYPVGQAQIGQIDQQPPNLQNTMGHVKRTGQAQQTVIVKAFRNYRILFKTFLTAAAAYPRVVGLGPEVSNQAFFVSSNSSCRVTASAVHSKNTDESMAFSFTKLENSRHDFISMLRFSTENGMGAPAAVIRPGWL